MYLSYMEGFHLPIHMLRVCTRACIVELHPPIYVHEAYVDYIRGLGLTRIVEKTNLHFCLECLSVHDLIIQVTAPIDIDTRNNS